jgi:hypothetical protein
MRCLSHSPCHDHSNYIWRSVQVTKLQFPPTSRHCILILLYSVLVIESISRLIRQRVIELETWVVIHLVFVSRLHVSYWGTVEFVPLPVIIAELLAYVTRFSFCSTKTAIIIHLHSESGNFLLVITVQANTSRSCIGFILFAEWRKSQLCLMGEHRLTVQSDEHKIQRSSSICAPRKLTQAETLLIRIRKVPGSSFSRNADHPDWGASWSS